MLTTMKDFINQHVKNEITDFNNSNCEYCNACCSMLTPLEEDEYKNLHKFLIGTQKGVKILKEGWKIYDKHLKKGIIYFDCLFSEPTTKKCKIYDMRPNVCRSFHCSEDLCEKDYKTTKPKTLIMTGHLFIPQDMNRIINFMLNQLKEKMEKDK